MERYCPYCMHPVQPGQPCPNCKRDPETYHPESRQLPPGTLLQERYVLGRALGAGGFGITYLGWDLKLERRVAVKEYFPTAFLKRETSVTLDVTCYTASGQEAYTKGREQFLREARTMAALEKIPQMVRVLDFFPEHNTAYIVMEFLEGQTLKEITQAQGPCSAQVLLPMLEPVIRAMESMHQANIIHRDISPDNLMLLSNGTMKLMDFGCARDIQGEVTMTAMLKEGFAPYEQYSGHGQGAWSDLYSLCATIYYCLTGKVPPSAMKRGEPDPLIPPSRLGAELTEQQGRALLKGLAVRAADRWKSMGELYGALYGITLDGHPWTPPEDWEQWNTSKLDPEPEPAPEPKPEKKFTLSRGAKGGIAACAGVILVTALAASGLLGGGTDQVVLSDGDATSLSQPVIADGEEEDPQAEDSSRLDPNALLQPDTSPEGMGGQQGEESNGDAGRTQTGEEGGGQEPVQTQPSTPPTSNSQATPSSGGQTKPSTTEPEPEPVPTKAELETQVEAHLDANQFAEAAAVYRQMNALGYISREKLGSSLVEVGDDAEYYWSETDYGNNNSPYVKTAFDLYTEAAGLGCAQAYAKLAYCYDYGRSEERRVGKECRSRWSPYH